MQITNGDHRKEHLERYEILLNDLYLEPVTDDVVGCFLEVETILEAPEAQNVVTKKKKVESKDKVKVKSKDGQCSRMCRKKPRYQTLNPACY